MCKCATLCAGESGLCWGPVAICPCITDFQKAVVEERWYDMGSGRKVEGPGGGGQEERDREKRRR